MGGGAANLGISNGQFHILNGGLYWFFHFGA